MSDKKMVLISLRIPEDLRAKVEAGAKVRGTSMNRLICDSIEDFLTAPDIANRVEQMLEPLLKKAAMTGFRAGFDFATETRGE